ncbi:MAG: hypothetical protein ACRCZ0_08840 [Cetobacterium sp.]
MAINREALASLIATQTGNNDFTVDMINDEMLTGLFLEEEIVVDEVIEEQDVVQEEGDEEIPEEEIEQDLLDGINVDELTGNERVFYDYIIKQQQKAKAREISLLIDGSQLDSKNRSILNRMATAGLSREAIEETIVDLKQIQASSARTAPATKIISKNKVKTSAPQVTEKTPKIGTKDFGKYLAELRKTKKI